jgi:hypothetical protein
LGIPRPVGWETLPWSVTYYLNYPLQFMKMNGYANTFYGWGGEDDDLDHRIKQQNFTILRSPTNISRFYMQLHGPVSCGQFYQPIVWKVQIRQQALLYKSCNYMALFSFTNNTITSFTSKHNSKLCPTFTQTFLKFYANFFEVLRKLFWSFTQTFLKFYANFFEVLRKLFCGFEVDQEWRSGQSDGEKCNESISRGRTVFTEVQKDWREKFSSLFVDQSSSSKRLLCLWGPIL